jgi:hypothetical protein
MEFFLAHVHHSCNIPPCPPASDVTFGGSAGWGVPWVTGRVPALYSRRLPLFRPLICDGFDFDRACLNAPHPNNTPFYGDPMTAVSFFLQTFIAVIRKDGLAPKTQNSQMIVFVSIC